MENNDKYNISVDNTSPNVSTQNIKSYQIENLRSTISSVRFTDETRYNLSKNGECIDSIPTVVVEFQTENSRFYEEYYLDPFVSQDEEIPKHRLFGTIVSEAVVDWTDITDIIGSVVYLSRDVDSIWVTTSSDPKPPVEIMDFDSIPAIKTKDNLEDELVYQIYRQIYDSNTGYAEICNITVDEDVAIVDFELPSKNNFSNTFDIHTDDASKKTARNNILSNTEEKYDFWDLCKDVIGYIPQKSEYNDLIGNKVPAEYYRGKWYTEGKLVDSNN